MKIAFVTYATPCYKYSYADSNRYIKYAERLKNSLGNYELFVFNESNLQAPSHHEVNYGFKPYAINHVRKLGYDIVIWVDSAIFAIKPFEHFIEYIKENGFVFFDNIGFSISSYTNDNCLNYFKVKREKMNNEPMIMACLMGFNFKNKLANKIFKQYYKSSVPECFNGDWRNHRHDQSAMSIILSKNKVKPLHPHSTFLAYPYNEGHKPESQTVCFHNL